MLIASLSIGDSLVTLSMVTPITADKSEQINGRTYNLAFTDLPTDNTYTKVYTGECDALYALAAWIAADEADGSWFDTAVATLRSDPCTKKHMP